MKVPIQTTTDVRVLAQAASIFMDNGIILKSKSDLIDQIISNFCMINARQGKVFNESDALDYLSRIRLGINSQNKRQVKIINSSGVSGLNQPSNTDLVSIGRVQEMQANVLREQLDIQYMKNNPVDIDSEEFDRQALIRIATKRLEDSEESQYDRLMRINTQFLPKKDKTNYIEQEICESPNLDRFTEAARMREKESLGLDAGGAVVCEEDQQSYNEYVAKQQAKGKMPATIADFLSGNIPIDPS